MQAEIQIRLQEIKIILLKIQEIFRFSVFKRMLKFCHKAKALKYGVFFLRLLKTLMNRNIIIAGNL